MELLLILSAMLSAVTGAFTGRAPEAPQAQAAVAAQAVAQAVPAARPATQRPVAAIRRPTDWAPPAGDSAPAVAAPLDAVRLIE